MPRSVVSVGLFFIYNLKNKFILQIDVDNHLSIKQTKTTKKELKKQLIIKYDKQATLPRIKT